MRQVYHKYIPMLPTKLDMMGIALFKIKQRALLFSIFFQPYTTDVLAYKILNIDFKGRVPFHQD